jgi:signal transduction histidine kinase
MSHRPHATDQPTPERSAPHERARAVASPAIASDRGGARGEERRVASERRLTTREGAVERRLRRATPTLLGTVPGATGAEVSVALARPPIGDDLPSPIGDAEHEAPDGPPAPRQGAGLSVAALGTLVELVTDPLYVVDREWRLRFVNRRAAELWRTAPEQVVGRSLWSVLPQTAGTATHDRLARAMRDQQPAHFESFSSRLGGWVEVSAYPIGDGLLVLHRDVAMLRVGDEAAVQALSAERRAREEAERLMTELRAARTAADEARRSAEQARVAAEVAARAKSDFLATMSHELRTPINAVTGYAQLLELGMAGPVTDTQRDYLERVLTSSRHLLGLVDDVLDLARLEAGRMVIEQVPGSAAAVVGGALALVASQAAARGVRMVEPGLEAEATFVGDEHRVRQILVNLLTNAIKFTPTGGTIEVEIAPDARPGHPAAGEQAPLAGRGPWMAVQIRDTGVGIPTALHEAIFEPFVQGDGSRTRTVGGTGLGLAVSRGLARLMGGDLTVQSELGQGASFTLWLPSRVASAPPMADAAEERPRVVAGLRGGRARHARPAMAAVAHSEQRVHGLSIAGTRLRQQLETLLEGYLARLRADPTIPHVAGLARTQLEDHALSFVGDLAQTLVALEQSGGLDGDLLRDGSAIQEEIAYRHGEQRHRLGWSEAHLRREYAILRDEIDTLVRQTAASGGVDVALALSVLHRLLARALEISLRGWRHAASR